MSTLPVTFRAGALSVTGDLTVVDDTSPVADAGSLPVGAAMYPVPAGAVFMAADGSDATGTGTQAKPYATLAKAVAACPAGGTIVVRGGVYNDGGDTQGGAYTYGVTAVRGVTIQNYPGEAVWFDGSVPFTTPWTKAGATWSTPYTMLFDRSPTSSSGADDGWGASTGAGGWWVAASDPTAAWPDMIFIDGTRLRQVPTLADVAPGTFYVEGATTTGKWFRATRVHIGADPAGREVRYANRTKLITLAGRTNTSTIRGVGIRRYATYTAGWGALYIQHRTRLENIVLADTSALGLMADESPGLTLCKVTAPRIGLNLMISNRTDDILLDRVLVTENNWSRFNLFGPVPAVAKISRCQRVRVDRCIFRDSYTTGFWTDVTVESPVITNTLIQGMANRGIDYETSQRCVLANSKILNCGSMGLFLNDSGSTQVWNCTFSGNGWGKANETSTACPTIHAGQSPRRWDVPAYSFCIDSRLPTSYYRDDPENQWTFRSIVIQNTVLANPGRNTYSALSTNNSGDTTRPAATWRDWGLDVDHNVYQWQTAPRYPWLLANGQGKAQTICYSLGVWQATTGLDQASTFQTVDPLDGDGQVTDPALHAKAAPLPADIAALIGQPSGTRRMGAFW